MSERSSRRVGKAGGCFLLLSIGAFLGAGQAAYTVLKNWNPTKMECTDYFRERPNVEWLHLENCSLNLLEVSYRKIPTSASGFRVDEVYIRAYLYASVTALSRAHRNH